MTNTNPELLKTLRLDTLNQINQGTKRTHRFNVDYSDVNPEFVGSFKLHHPSQMEKLVIGSNVSRLLGGNLDVDTMTYNIATIIATLDVVIDERPDWFNPYSDTLDYDILENVFLEYMNWLNSFRRKPKQDELEGNSEDRPSEV